VLSTHLAALEDLARLGSSNTSATLALCFSGGLGRCEGKVSCAVMVLEAIRKNSLSQSPSLESHAQRFF